MAADDDQLLQGVRARLDRFDRVRLVRSLTVAEQTEKDELLRFEAYLVTRRFSET